MIKDSQTKFCKKRANVWSSEECILLGLNKYDSKYITQQLKWPSEKDSVTGTCFTDMGEGRGPENI